MALDLEIGSTDPAALAFFCITTPRGTVDSREGVFILVLPLTTEWLWAAAFLCVDLRIIYILLRQGVEESGVRVNELFSNCPAGKSLLK